jgi:cholesterol transport system auxiliary component
MRNPPVSPSPATGRSRPARRLAAAALLSSLAGACSSAPAPTTYDLSAPSGRIRGSVGVQVLVAQPAAIAPLAGQQILVKDAGGTITFLANGQWADELPDLVQARLIHTFENASLLQAVARPSSGAVADAQLVTEIRSFEVLTPDNEAFAQVSAKLVSERDGRIIRGRIFAARVPVGSVDAPNAARALDEALSAVMLDIVRWVSASPIPSRDAPPADTAT